MFLQIIATATNLSQQQRLKQQTLLFFKQQISATPILTGY